MDFEFECQFAYITNDGEQQQQQTTAEGNARAVDGGGGGGGGVEANEAKRLKQEWTMAIEQQAGLHMYLEFVDLNVNWYNIVLFLERNKQSTKHTPLLLPFEMSLHSTQLSKMFVCYSLGSCQLCKLNRLAFRLYMYVCICMSMYMYKQR